MAREGGGVLTGVNAQAHVTIREGGDRVYIDQRAWKAGLPVRSGCERLARASKDCTRSIKILSIHLFALSWRQIYSLNIVSVWIKHEPRIVYQKSVRNLNTTLVIIKTTYKAAHSFLDVRGVRHDLCLLPHYRTLVGDGLG